MTGGGQVLRLRCPKDVDPDQRHRHVAGDFRLPMTVDVFAFVGTSLSTCPCGERMVVAGGPGDEAEPPATPR